MKRSLTVQTHESDLSCTQYGDFGFLDDLAAAEKPRLTTYGRSGVGKCDGKLWDMGAKKEIWGAWDPAAERFDTNFNPFERDRSAVNGEGKYDGKLWYMGAKKET